MKVNLRAIVLGTMYVAFGAVVLSSGAQASGSRGYDPDCNGVLNCNEVTDESNNANANADADARANSRSSGFGVGVGIGEGGDASATGGSAYSGSNSRGGNADASSGVSDSGNSRNRNVNVAGSESGVENSGNSSSRSGAAVLGSGNSGSSSGSSIASETSLSTDTSLTVEGDTDNSSYSSEFIIPSYAAAGYSNNLIVDCQRILGFDFRGSGQTQARGASFGIPLPGGACRLEKATLQAFDLGNYEMGWTLYCAQKAVWKGMRTTTRAMTGSKLTKNAAIRQCFDTARVITAPASDYVTKEVFNETVERAFVQAQSK